MALGRTMVACAVATMLLMSGGCLQMPRIPIDAGKTGDFFTSFEANEPKPTWTNAVETDARGYA